ncbi:probable tRNA (uracil-O(2)-)-methyltransferase [Oppia nitens]|uniref:probable tRNA (uracil-O(2)-)-methyltransferase n=1 Tax=Oppia nitens TaxID=1686743 RepID=UPI0023D9AC2B|nr:probable tRNA (uracil-O(2)-)-methyltransferase [Oppia nitens]
MSDPKSSYWTSLFVYIERPNLINKRLMGSHVLNCWHINDNHNNNNIIELMRISSLSDIKQRLEDCVQISDIQLSHLLSIGGRFLIVRQLLLKQSLKHLSQDSHNDSNKDVIDYVLVDISNTETVFISFISNDDKCHVIPESSHKFLLNGLQEIEIKYLFGDEPNIWLNEKVLPKLQQWMRQELEGNQTSGSLQLISVDTYCLTYNRLKKTYGQPLVEMWKKYETTDPLKFVFEDIAIASYLIVLWEEERQLKQTDVKQSFVDIGCGNGLLVYLLTNEGYKGLGIDLRKRNIWDKYEPRVDLMEKVFTPSDESLNFDGYDWLIGNHSDELTPWIPYIACNCSPKMNVFLLPCCPFDFNGTKYQRTDSSLSQYHCYIKYLQKVCQELGFVTKIDKLRIPSTKRTCLVCDRRNYDSGKESDMKVKRKAFINEKINDFNDYKPREKVETVRNCTRVSKDTIESIVDTIAKQLISGNNSLTIASISKLLNKDLLKQLKSQCGGLQTLLRNHKHIFEVSNSLIGFTQPKPIAETIDANKHLKSKQCWFFHNHPNGCPLPDAQCRYKH